ncbi:MAG: hypothetical protein AAGH15_21235 [Myxococcota bacterium]
MLTTRCPSCGARAPLCLATPDRFTCPFCTYAGALPPQVAQELGAAAADLRAQAVATRQLTERQQALVSRSEALRWTYLLSAAAVALPLVLCLASSISGAIQDARFEGFAAQSLVGLCVCNLPLLLTAAGIAIGDRRVRKALTELKGLVAALPPLGPGQPHRCHVCGGPIAVKAGVGVARCGFCHADNLVSADARAEAQQARGEELAGYAARAQAGAARVAEVAGRVQKTLRRTVLGSVLAGWGLGSIVGCMVSAVLFGGETEVHPKDYVWWDTEDRGRCLAEVQRADDGAVRLDLRGRDQALTPAEAAALTPFPLERVLGMQLMRRRPSFPEAPGLVTGVHGTRGGSNRAVLTLASGEETEVTDLADLCLVAPAPPVK